jgi:hypothetical protein
MSSPRSRATVMTHVTNRRTFCIAVLVFALAASTTAAAQHVPKLSVQKYQPEIEKLMALSTGNTKKQPIGDINLKSIAMKY